jgi:hypothetical protein
VQEIAQRLMRIFVRDKDNHRPVYGGASKFQTDPHWKDLILFYEYFHGENGAGIGASHQTGWTGTIALLFQMLAGHTETQVNIKDAGSLKMQYEPANVEKVGVESRSGSRAT